MSVTFLWFPSSLFILLLPQIQILEIHPPKAVVLAQHKLQVHLQLLQTISEITLLPARMIILGQIHPPGRPLLDKKQEMEDVSPALSSTYLYISHENETPVDSEKYS